MIQSARNDPDYFDEDDDNSSEEEDELEEAMGECGLDREGACSLAGSEWCEFECPFRSHPR